MILVCPSCGATASAAAWDNDMATRDTIAAMLALPAPVGKVVLAYLGLFRPVSRALTWRKAHRITSELAALIAPGWVQVQGKPDRPCPPHIWAMAMEQMVAMGTIKRPLPNHNYLRQVAWSLADQVDAGAERHQHRQVLSGHQRMHRDDPPPAPAGEDLSQIERAWLAKYGSLPGSDPTKNPDVNRLAHDLAKRLSDKGDDDA